MNEEISSTISKQNKENQKELNRRSNALLFSGLQSKSSVEQLCGEQNIESKSAFSNNISFASKNAKYKEESTKVQATSGKLIGVHNKVKENSPDKKAISKEVSSVVKIKDQSHQNFLEKGSSVDKHIQLRYYNFVLPLTVEQKQTINEVKKSILEEHSKISGELAEILNDVAQVSAEVEVALRNVGEVQVTARLINDYCKHTNDDLDDVLAEEVFL